MATAPVMKIAPSTGSVVATYATGKGPFAVAFDETKIWVPNFASNSVFEYRGKLVFRVDSESGWSQGQPDLLLIIRILISAIYVNELFFVVTNICLR